MAKQRPVSEFFDTTDYPPSRMIQVNSCGSEHPNSHDFTILRSHGRSDYHILYLVCGYLDAEIGTINVKFSAISCERF